MIPIRTGLASLAVVALVASASAASPSDGVFGCADMYGVELGLLKISGASYTWTKTRTGFKPVEAKENGAGTLKIDGGYFWPTSGPMARWDVTGKIASNGININNKNGALMGCRRQ